MIAKEEAISLIDQYSSKPFNFSSCREINDAQIDKLSTDIVKKVNQSEEEWKELTQLKVENAKLRAENEVYKAFLLSSNYKLPKETKKKVEES